MVAVPLVLLQEDVPPLDVAHDALALNGGGDYDDVGSHHDIGSHHDGDDEGDAEIADVPSSPGKKSNKKKRDANTLRKAPQAPRRFKSSYIMFFTAKQDETKAELKAEAEAKRRDVTTATTVTEVSKRSAEKWRNLSAEERAFWEDEAAKDKQRYMREKAAYTGPWQVPWKRAKKDPSAPKRPMSAFLYFSQDRRKKIKSKNPGMKNTEVSQVLGEMWRNASEDEKRPHMEIEERERAKYKIEIAKWNEEKKARDEAQKKAQEEQQRKYAKMGAAAPPPPMTQQQGTYPPHQGPLPMQSDPSQKQNPPPPHAPQGYDPNMLYQQHHVYMHPPNAPYYMYPPPHHGYYTTYPPPPNGQPIVLGPNGMPQGAAPPPMYGPPPPQSMPTLQGQYGPGPYGSPPGPPMLPQQQQTYEDDGSGGVPNMQYSYPEPEQMGGHYQLHD